MTGIVTLAMVWGTIPARGQITNRLAVPNYSDIAITVIDTATNTIAGAPGNPPGASDAAVSLDGRTILIANSSNDTVTRFSLDPLSQAPTATVNTGLFTTALAITPDGRKAYVSSDQAVTVIDVTTMTVVQTLSTSPITQLGGVAITADGTLAYVTSGHDDEILVIDTATDTFLTPITGVGAGPLGISVAPNGRVYTANYYDDSVSIIDPGVAVITIPVGSSPVAVTIAPSGDVAYVSNGGDDTISVINLLNNSVSNTIPIASSCGCSSGPAGVAFTPDGRWAYVLLNTSWEVAVVDVQTETQTSTFVPAGIAPGALGHFISPNLIVPGNGPLTIGDDPAFTTLGFGRFVVFSGGTLQLSSGIVSPRDLSILGSGGTIDTNSFTAVFSGAVVGDGLLTKTGAGRLILSATGVQAPIRVTGGTLQFDGTHDGTVTVTAGSLVSHGTIATLVATGGTIRPAAGDDPGVLRVHDATLSESTTLLIKINGANAGTEYDRLDATGSTSLGNAALVLQLGYVPPSGATFVIATHVTGQFQNLPEGGVAIATSGRHFRISYHGGSGHDAALIADEPPTITGPADQTMLAGAVLGPIAFSVGDDLTVADAITMSAISSNPSLIAGVAFSGTGAARTLKLTPFAGESGTAQITLIAWDGAQSATATFTVTVVAIPSYHLAEGATSAFFDTDILLANPNPAPAPVTITFFRDDASTLTQHRLLPATSRTTIRVKEIDGLDATAFSTAVTSNSGLPLVVERTMWWDATGYGAHGEKASSGPASQWYFAEGAQGYFHTYFLLLNTHETANVAHVTYFLESGAPIVRDYALAPTSRRTVDIAAEPALADKSFGALVTFDLPGMAERAMYFGTDPIYSGGHDSAGVTAPARTWLLAEGATGTFFDTFVLIANPGDLDTTVTITYLPASGAPIVKSHPLAAHQRLTVNIADEDPALASAAVGAQISADQPVVVERSMYWPHGNWYEAHNATGETAPDTHWGLAEGRVGGPRQAQTYILLANPGADAATVTATFLRTSGATIVKTFTVPASSRLNVAVTGAGSDVPELADEEFGATLVSTRPIIVERSLYTNANGVTWAAGTNATGTRLP